MADDEGDAGYDLSDEEIWVDEPTSADEAEGDGDAFDGADGSRG